MKKYMKIFSVRDIFTTRILIETFNMNIDLRESVGLKVTGESVG